MRCHRVQRLLPDYIGYELSTKKRGRVEQHLEACPDCKAELATLQGVWEGLDQQPLLFEQNEKTLPLFHNNIRGKHYYH